jgi:hypothetical protein
MFRLPMLRFAFAHPCCYIHPLCLCLAQSRHFDIELLLFFLWQVPSSSMKLISWHIALKLTISLSSWCHAQAMFSKRGRDKDPGQGTGKRFRANVVDLFLGSTNSAERIRELAEDAHDAGADGVRDFKKIKKDRNVHRNMLRRVLKGCQWPPVYYAPVRVWDRKQQKTEVLQYPMLLAHEVLDTFACRNAMDQLLATTGMGQLTVAHLAQSKAALGIDEAVGLGFWLDGVPCNWDRTESIECLTMSFPGMTGANKAIRIPLAVISKRFQIDHHTWDDILKVQAWSLQYAAAGVFPPCREDGKPFTYSTRDHWRLPKAGKPLKAPWLHLSDRWKPSACLCMYMYACCFRFSYQQEAVSSTGGSLL